MACTLSGAGDKYEKFTNQTPLFRPKIVTFSLSYEGDKIEFGGWGGVTACCVLLAASCFYCILTVKSRAHIRFAAISS